MLTLAVLMYTGRLLCRCIWSIVKEQQRCDGTMEATDCVLEQQRENGPSLRMKPVS